MEFPRLATDPAAAEHAPADPLAQLNTLPRGECVRSLQQCCSSRWWAEELADRRPFADVAAVLAAADDVWNECGPDAWREAFAGHPRIGESKAASETSATQQKWSEGEQSVAARADAEIRAKLADAQQEYEARFGHIFLICATGRTAAEILAELHERMSNDPETELRVAAREQGRITKLRLEKLLTS
jgi:OHCU decarboxylase